MAVYGRSAEEVFESGPKSGPRNIKSCGNFISVFCSNLSALIIADQLRHLEGSNGIFSSTAPGKSSKFIVNILVLLCITCIDPYISDIYVLLYSSALKGTVHRVVNWTQEFVLKEILPHPPYKDQALSSLSCQATILLIVTLAHRHHSSFILPSSCHNCFTKEREKEKESSFFQPLESRQDLRQPGFQYSFRDSNRNKLHLRDKSTKDIIVRLT